MFSEVLKKTSYFNSSLAKIFIKYSDAVRSVEKYFPVTAQNPCILQEIFILCL